MVEVSAPSKWPETNEQGQRLGNLGAPEAELSPDVSVVVPAFNEAASIELLLDELQAALRGFDRYEVVYVDDGSTDETPVELKRLASSRPWLKHLRHDVCGGKSAALWTGVLAANAAVVATLDADGRNDPAVVPQMVAELAVAGPGCGLVAGQRIGRHDTALTRLRSKVANTVRAAFLDDGTRDTTCGLKCFPRTVFLDLPFFEGFHRYLPALIRRDGYAISLIDVVDRPSWRTVSRPSVFAGLRRAVWDLVGVSWLIHRRGSMPSVVAEQGHPVSDVEAAPGHD
jgi:glycosyltransferase involved in cell wall biosynthesis